VGLRRSGLHAAGAGLAPGDRAVARRHPGRRVLPALHHDPARHGGATVRRREAEHFPAAERSRPGPGLPGVPARRPARRRDRALPLAGPRPGGRRAPVHGPGTAGAAGPGRRAWNPGTLRRTPMVAAREGSGGRWRSMRAPRAVLMGVLLVWGAAPAVWAG